MTQHIFKTAISILVISNHNTDNCFRALFDKIAPVGADILYEKYIYILVLEFGQPRQPALCQLYRHTFVPYCYKVT